MTKETKNILQRDSKKYRQLAEYTDEENRNVYEKIINYIENILENE